MAGSSTGWEVEHASLHFRTRRGDIRSRVLRDAHRRTRRWPHTKYRRQMKRRFYKKVFGQRWQVESAFSRQKRRLSAHLRAKTWNTQQPELLLNVLTYNLSILRLTTTPCSTEQLMPKF